MTSPPRREVRVAHAGDYDASKSFYERVHNAHLHPLVRYFLSLGNTRIVNRYCHMHPEVLPAAVEEALTTTPRYFRWGGADLFHTTTEFGDRRIVVIETNSSPSGQKSMPLYHEAQEQAGYRKLLETTFMPIIERKKSLAGGLAVLYDKNPMETQAYAKVLAELADEPVYLVPFFADDPDPPARFNEERVLEIRTPEGKWLPIRAGMRYVTQRPWTRIPPLTRTALLNPVLICLAGGRNKLLAAKAYDLYNAHLRGTGLSVRTPETIWDVSRAEVPLWVQRMGGYAVVKNPYSNAGQGVWTITTEAELDEFMELEQRYDRFIVQSLVGNAGWSSKQLSGRLYHVGTVPTKRGHIYVADLRFMVGAGPEGFYPVALYARRARHPLAAELTPESDSWAMLGTNLSVKLDHGEWATESERLLLMDSKDFNQLGLGVDDLIEGYIQSVLAVNAIDRMAQQLVTQKKTFRRRFFRSLNPDDKLAEEII